VEFVVGAGRLPTLNRAGSFDRKSVGAGEGQLGAHDGPALLHHPDGGCDQPYSATFLVTQCFTLLCAVFAAYMMKSAGALVL
jgi:hypothetical protein